MWRVAAAVLFLWATSATDSAPTQLDGLSATLEASPTKIPMGDAIQFRVTLAFDTTSAVRNTRLLNQFSGHCRFLFVSEKTGKSYERLPYDSGMLATPQPGNLALLKHGSRLSLEDLTVHLLSAKGEQVPPGEYSVTAMYQNDGGGETEVYLDSLGQYHERVYDGPWALWTGTIQSKPCIVTILPASEETVEIAVPKTLVVDDARIPGQIGWRYEASSRVRVNKRPGFAIGYRWHLETRVDGTTVSEYPRGEGGLDSSAMSFLPPDVSERVKTGKDAELILHMEVFETSVQPGHVWMPESGDFRILWSGQARYKFGGKGK